MAPPEAGITINRPVREVFEIILDGANNARWRPAVTDVQRAPETLMGTGAVFKHGLKGPVGRRMDGDYKITQCQPNQLIEFQVIAGPARPVGCRRGVQLNAPATSLLRTAARPPSPSC